MVNGGLVKFPFQNVEMLFTKGVESEKEQFILASNQDKLDQDRFYY